LKSIFIFHFLLAFSLALVGQDSLLNIKVIETDLLTDLRENNSCSMKDFSDVANFYLEEGTKEEFNIFFSSFFSSNPDSLKFSFLQDLVKSSFQYADSLEDHNYSKFSNYYESLRSRFGYLLISHQELLLTSAEFHFSSNNTELGYSCLSEVMKIYESRFITNDFLNQTRNYSKTKLKFISSQLAHKAFTLFVSQLPVDDYRFKMFAKNERYRKYRTQNKYSVYKIINTKLNSEGYISIEIPNQQSEGRIKIDMKKIIEDEKKETEAYKKKYDWIKKE